MGIPAIFVQFVRGSLFLVERERKQDSTYSSEQEKDPTQLTLAQSIDRSRQYPPNSLQAQEINKAVSHFFSHGDASDIYC